MPPPPVLRTDRLVLRMPEPGEADAVLDFYERNREFLAPTQPALPLDFFTARFWEAQLAKNHTDFADDRALRVFVFHGEQVIGVTNLFGIARGALQTATLGYAIDAAHQGRGLMHEALVAFIAYAFGPLGLHRLAADHLPDNHRSAALLARLGFAVEGYSRRYLRMSDGLWHDHVRTALVREG